MKFVIKKLFIFFTLLTNFFLFSFSYAYGDNHNFYEIIEQLQKDIKTLEKAVYSNSTELNGNTNG